MTRPRFRHRLFLPVIPVLFLLLLLGPVTELTARERTVVIVPLQYLTGPKDQAILSLTVPDSLATSLRNIGGFKMLTIPGLAEGTQTGFDRMMDLASRSNADIVITGSIAILGGTADIDLEAIDTATKRVRVAEGARGPVGIELFDLIDRLCSSMSRKMAAELPPLQEYEVTREVAKIEEIYVNDLRKNHRFLLGIGSGLAAVSARKPDITGILSGSSAGGIGFIIMGYGFKGFRADMAGTPPIPQFGLENALNAGWISLTFDLSRIPLYLGTTFHFLFMSSVDFGNNNQDSFMMSPMLGPTVGLRVGRTFRIGFTPGFSFIKYQFWTPAGNFDQKFRLPPLHVHLEWNFYREFGLFLGVSYANIYSDGGNRASVWQFFPAFIYKTDF